MCHPVTSEDVQKLTAALEALVTSTNASLTKKKETSLPDGLADEHRKYLQQYLDHGGESLEKAHAAALDIRKFEIDLYWKRSGYFWAIIAATVAAYGLLLSSSMKDGKILSFTTQFTLFGISLLGCIFSQAWLLANKGSKFWQANWETQVEILEDLVMGPLYKTVFAEHTQDVVNNLRKAQKKEPPRHIAAAQRLSICSETQPEGYYYGKNQVFATIYSPTKINDQMAKLFFWLFMCLTVMSIAFLAKNIFQPIFPSQWDDFLTSNYKLACIKGSLVIFGILGFAFFSWKFNRCKTTTPMAHKINLTQRNAYITANLTEALEAYETWKTNPSTNADCASPQGANAQ